jgi:hypothetical protein
MLYSVDSMTTRGASGLMLQRHWQMMGALEAADGMLLFGISTAHMFAVVQPLAYIIMQRIAEGWPNSRIDELMPWAWSPVAQQKAA